MQDEKLQASHEESGINLSAIFAKRNSNVKDDEPETVQVNEEVVAKDQNDLTGDHLDEEPVEQKKDKEPDSEPEKEKKDQESEQDYKSEFENLERRYKGAIKLGNESRKKLAAYEKAIKKYSEEGVLSTDEAESLLDYTQFEDVPLEDEPAHVKYAKIWDEGIERMREFADDPQEIDKYVHAFQQLWRDSAPSEQEDILEEFSELGDSKAALTRKMIKMGKDYFDEVFGEVYEAGSIRNFKKKFAEKEKDYNKKLDKLQKEIDKYKKKYEDYTEPTYKLPSGGSDDRTSTKKPASTLEEIFSKRRR